MQQKIGDPVVAGLRLMLSDSEWVQPIVSPVTSVVISAFIALV